MPLPNVGMLFTPPLKDGKGVKAGVKEAARTLAGFYRRHVRLMSADLACRVARRLLKERGGSAVTGRLGWTPGDAAPAFRETESIDSLGLTHPIPSSALPPEDWFRINTIVSEMRLATLVRRERVLAGYFVDSRAFER